jgi:glycosyltransferase involved in cell wall biosynthesis
MTYPIEFSAAIPCLNEAENVAAIVKAVAREFEKAQVDSYEMVFIDNGSTDGTIDILKGICADDHRIRLIVNNQNYGQMRSPTYGIYQTKGAAVVAISSDFQDPPELIGQFIERWRAGALIVLGVRQSERQSFVMRMVRAIGYGFFERFGDYRVIPGATGFGLYDRRVVDTLKQWRDPEPFFRGMLVESGYRLETIPYHRPERAGGASKNNFGTMLSFALAGLASCSKKLLRVPLYLAVLTFITTFVTVLAAIVIAIFGRPPWLALGLAVAQGAFATLCLFLGLIGEQVRMISEMSRNTPLVIERERINFPEPADQA